MTDANESSPPDPPPAHDVAPVQSLNPFKAREHYSRSAILAYKICIPVSWLVLVITSFYYVFEPPHEGNREKRTIWNQNDFHLTPFTMNSIITSVYWIILFVLQIGCYCYLYSSDKTKVAATANVGMSFIIHNLLVFGFIHLWVRSYFWLAELLLVINFFNVLSSYFCHRKYPCLIQLSCISGPLAWTFVALFWNGAVMVNAHTVAARIAANVFIWSILLDGMFCIVAFKDCTIGMCLSVLTAAIGVSQYLHKTFKLQWIFAFIIMGILFVLSLAVDIPGYLGRDPFKRKEIEAEDHERAPLLAGQ